MFFLKPKSYLGVDFGAGGVKLVELRQDKKRPVLFTYGFTSRRQDIHHLLPKGEKTAEQLLSERQTPAEAASSPESPLATEQHKINEYAALIRTVCREAKTVGTQAIVSLPVSAVFHTVVTLPRVKKEEFEHILKAEVKKLLPYKLEETQLDFELLKEVPEAKSQRVIVNAVPRTMVEFYTRVFERAGLKLLALEPESAALSRSLVGRDAALSMIIDAGAERTNFFIIDGGVPMTHHSIELGGLRINQLLARTLGMEEAMIERIKRDLFGELMAPSSEREKIVDKASFTEFFFTIIEPIMKEIQYGFDLYLRQSGNEQKRPEKIILTGGAALFPYLSEIIADKFKIKCYVGDPWGRIVYQESLKRLLHEIGPRMSVAIGLALRALV